MQSARTPATEAAAAHAHRVQQLQRVADALQQKDSATTVPLVLDVLPALLQYLLSSDTKIEEHVAFQNLERLCLEAVGQDHLMPTERYANLQAFERAQQSMFGQACTHFMHGQGWKADRAATGAMRGEAHDLSNPAMLLYYRNSGQRAPCTIARSMPAADLYGGAQLHDLLNFWDAALCGGTAVTFTPRKGSSVTFVDMAMDGFLLGAGTVVDEHNLNVVGLERCVRYKEARRVLAMDDAGRSEWLKANPPLETALEFMLTTSDNKVSGHLGFTFVVSEGDHRLVAQRLSEMLSYTRICKGCLERAWCDGMTPAEAAAALRAARDTCDAFCGACAAGDDGCEHAGEHWTKRRCSCCVAAGTLCQKLVVLGGALDCGGNQAGLIRRSHDGTLETEEPHYYGDGEERLYGLPLLPDPPHMCKSQDSNLFHNKIWLDGWLCGSFQLWSRYYDADTQRREAVRRVLTRRLLRRKNKYSVEEAIARREQGVCDALISPAECAAERAWAVHTLGPSRERPWNTNSESMYGEPMGGEFHEASNQYFYVDRDLAQGRVLRLAHSPCDTSAFTSAPTSSTKLSRLREPIGLALIGTNAYITDSSHERPTVYVISVAATCKRFSAAGVAAVAGSASGAVAAMKLRGTPVLREPYGITANADASELYVTDRQLCAVLRITLKARDEGVVEKLCDLPAKPAGIARVPTAHVLVVAAGDAVYSVSTRDANAQPVPVLRRAGASFCGVAVAPAALKEALFAIDHIGNAVVCLHRAAAPASQQLFEPSSNATVLAGGNAMRPCSGTSSVWYEGTASKVQLWRPTFAAFARNALIFSNSGHGKFGKVLLLNDLYPMAAKLLPTLLETADAFGLSRDRQRHASNRTQAAAMLEGLRDMLDGIEDGNAEYNPARGLEGPMGNFSGVVRRSARQISDLLLEQVSYAASLGAPQSCLDALSPQATTTLGPETFFIGARSRSRPSPYAKQFAEFHATAVEVEFARLSETAFSYCTSDQRPGRGHYNESGSAAAPIVRRLAKPKPLALSVEKRARRLAVLRALAAYLQQARQQRVTEKGREKSGTKPAPFYGPPTLLEASDVDPSLLEREGGSSSSGSASGSGGGTAIVLYRTGELVYIKPTKKADGVWLAILLDPIVRIGSEFNLDRVRCRYFQPTADLADYACAMKFWGKLGPQLRLANAEGAKARAAASDGVHFSFCNADHVTRTTVRGRIEMSALAEQQLYRGTLISFAAPADLLAEARTVCHGGTPTAVESDEDSEADAEDAEAQPLHAGEAERLAASSARYAEIVGKRVRAAEKGPTARGARKCPKPDPN